MKSSFLSPRSWLVVATLALAPTLPLIAWGAEGALSWAKQAGGGEYDVGYGIAVSDLAGVRVTAASLACSAGAGSTDQSEEDASGSSGLQSLGVGYYQYNWKTPKGYTGSCKS